MKAPAIALGLCGIAWSNLAFAQPSPGSETVQACIEDHVAFQEHELEGALDEAQRAAESCARLSCPKAIRDECHAALARLETTTSDGDDGKSSAATTPVSQAIPKNADPPSREPSAGASPEIPPPATAESDGPDAGLVLAYAGFATAGAGLVAFAIGGGVALYRRDQLAAACGGPRCPSEYQSYLDGGRTAAHVATAGAVIGLAGAAVGTVGLVLALGHEDEAHVTLSPLRIGVGGRF